MFNIPYLTSCNHCREKKRKCNGERPTCSLCRAHNVPCEYRRSRRFRKRAQNIAGMPLHNIMPGPEPPVHQQQQQHVATNGYAPGSQPLNGSQGPASAPPISEHTFNKPYSVGMYSMPASADAAQFQQKSFGTPQLPGTLPSEVNALTRLLAGDMYPQTQQLPQPILQGVNTFMSPFSDARNQLIPEWISQQKPEAAIISNLENIASAYQASPLMPLQTATTPDGNLLGNLTSQLMQSGGLFQPHPFSLNGQQPMPLAQGGVPNSAFTTANMLAPVTAALPPNASVGYANSGLAQPPVYRRPSSLVSSNHDGEANWTGSPGSARLKYPPSHGTRSPSTGARSDNSMPLASMILSSPEPSKRISVHDLAEAKPGRPGDPSPIVNHTQQQPQLPLPPTTQLRVGRYPDGFVPEVIRIYAQEFPAELSPEVLLRVMRGICSSTRTSLINVDLELSWCMILKGIIPRILLFAYIASMARGQAIDADLMPLLPAQFDELCYEVAVKDIPLAIASPSLWGALSLHLIGRYEFQSARYDLMTEHYEMASNILAKTTFHGYAFPWKDVPEHLKHTFEYDYYVYTFWVGFQWHLVSCFNLDRPFNVDIDPRSLPVPTNTRGYFTPDLPCSFDLLTLLPANSWPRSQQTKDVGEVWFRGFTDPEYLGWRPTEWNEIKPNYKITVYLQRMLPLGAQLYRMQCRFGEGKLSLAEYLQHLHTQQELLKRWLYSLPEEFEITLAKVTHFTKGATGQRSPSENKNLLMDFKELIMTYALYSTFMIRANRVALLGMLQENLAAPATSMGMRIFGLRDYFDAVAQTGQDCDFGAGGSSMWQKNLAFHKCRMQCYESMDILCDVVQLSFILRLDLFTYGTTYVAIAGEMLNVLISQLGVDDCNEKWKTKTRLGHVLCLLRSLQHWAPALYMFVYGIQALSDPSIVLDVEPDAQRGSSSEHDSSNVSPTATAIASAESDQAHPRPAPKDSGKATGEPAEMPNPFPPKHIINRIVADLDVSLATFLAPAYPMLLLKIFASKV
ncbi:hypothetical protein IWW55_000418 [Coemansia sp. RSA 2706]|nr:hypothetical protein IWW55_000418 [Coemansia sp. RSA 2706]